MRIGVLTYHYVYNEGAIWQGITLCRYLREQHAEHQVELIDYRYAPKYESIRSARKPEIVASYDAVVAPFLSCRPILDTAPEAALQSIGEQYDAVIVGSDIIWQFAPPMGPVSRFRHQLGCHGPLRPDGSSAYRYARDVKNWCFALWRGTRHGDPRKIPFPNVYWLSPEMPCRRGALAASIGYSQGHGVSDRTRREMRRRISTLDYISVRDRPSLAFVRELCPEDAGRIHECPDPAWLCREGLPCGRALRHRAGLPAPGEEKLAGVLIPPRGRWGSKLQQWVLPLLRARGFRTVSIIDANPETDVDVAAGVYTPSEWWSWISEMDFLVTVRTHPSIAALKYGTPLANIDITAMSSGSPHSKSADMLSHFELDDCCMFRADEFSEHGVAQLIDHALSREWAWGAIDARARANGALVTQRIEEMMACFIEEEAHG